MIQQLQAFKLRWEQAPEDPVAKGPPVESCLIDLTDDASESKPVIGDRAALARIAEKLRDRVKQPHPTLESSKPIENQKPAENPDGATKNDYVLPEHATCFNICNSFLDVCNELTFPRIVRYYSLNC